MPALQPDIVIHFEDDPAEVVPYDGNLRLPRTDREALAAYPRVLALVEQMLVEIDGGVCMANQAGPDHVGIVGWNIDDSDDGEGVARARLVYASFSVVDDGEEAFPICEDCALMLLAPRFRTT